MKFLFFSVVLLVSCEQKEASPLNNIEGNKLYKEGEELIQKDNLKAYTKFQEAIIYYSKQKDSSKISKSLIYQGIAQNYTGDILGSEASLVEALNYMKEGDESFYSVFGTLGNLKYDQKEYAEAEKWFTKALREKIEKFDERVNLINNKSASEYRQGKYTEALITLKQIDQSKISDSSLKSRIKENAIYINWLKNKSYPAQKEFEHLLHNKLKNNDLWGANSSYSHLAEINQNTNPDMSLYYAKQMLQNAIIIKSPEDRLEAMERIIPVDNPFKSKQNFADYKILSDSIQRSRNDYRKNFAYIKYDSEKKEIENQRLKTQKVQSDSLFFKQSIILLIILLGLILTIVWYRKRQIRLKQENELKIKENQLKISKKVHDVVANGIYQVMTKIENQESFNKNEALDELEFVYEKSRDISYEKIDLKNDEQNFNEKISELVGSFNNDNTNTYLAGNDKSLWKGVKESTLEEVYQVVRELLVNMKKHSKADRVVFKFERENNLIRIYYTDNGIGISGDVIYKNGLSSTVSRIETINGAIIFDTKIEKGLKINISFPIS